jgi:hypothetical protein
MSIDAPFGSDDDDNAMVDVMASGDDSRTDKGVDFESMASELDRVLNSVLKDRERKMVFYYQRIKAKYIQYHEVFEQDGKFGMKDHQGNILLSPTYDFLRTCYIYNDDLSIMPVIAEKNGKMGLVMPDGNDTVVADFLYDEICLRDEYPYFEASREGISGFIDKFGNFVNG